MSTTWEKECGALVLAGDYATAHLSNHRAWHDKLEGTDQA